MEYTNELYKGHTNYVLCSIYIGQNNNYTYDYYHKKFMSRRMDSSDVLQKSIESHNHYHK